MSGAEDKLKIILRTVFYRDGALPSVVFVNRELFFALWEIRVFDRTLDASNGAGSNLLYFYRGVQVKVEDVYNDTTTQK